MDDDDQVSCSLCWTGPRTVALPQDYGHRCLALARKAVAGAPDFAWVGRFYPPDLRLDDTQRVMTATVREPGSGRTGTATFRLDRPLPWLADVWAEKPELPASRIYHACQNNSRWIAGHGPTDYRYMAVHALDAFLRHHPTSHPRIRAGGTGEFRAPKTGVDHPLFISGAIPNGIWMIGTKNSDRTWRDLSDVLHCVLTLLHRSLRD